MSRSVPKSFLPVLARCNIAFAFKVISGGRRLDSTVPVSRLPLSAPQTKLCRTTESQRAKGRQFASGSRHLSLILRSQQCAAAPKGEEPFAKKGPKSCPSFCFRLSCRKLRPTVSGEVPVVGVRRMSPMGAAVESQDCLSDPFLQLLR